MLPRTSPYGNVPFRCSRQPYSGLLFDEMDHGKWKTFIVSGPSQSGKTLSTFVIPTLRDVKELRLNTIIGFPEADMASDKWDTDFKPTMLDSPELAWLLPSNGPGSKGGRIRDRITLSNGVDLKIMTRGGDDTAKAGYTSPRVRVTEAAGWSHTGESSVEANPLRQLKARMKAFKRNDPRRCLFVEGTLTIESELPWSARGDDDDDRLISSRSKILSPCPHCDEWIAPGREHLIGWQDAESEDQAANESVWLCPICKGAITNDQRRKAVADCRLVHAGQTVNGHGEVVGEAPPTTTLFFHWKGWDNLLRDIADFAAAEWEAAQIEEGTQEHENAEKELCQFDFSVPFKSSLSESEPLKPETVRKRRSSWPRNVLPHDTVKLTIGVDIGKFTSWWTALAWRENGQILCPAYGAFDVCRSPGDDLSTRIQSSLIEFNEQVVLPGFAVEGSDGCNLPDVVLVDCGFRPDDVADAVRMFGKGWTNRWKAARGRGKSIGGGGYNHRNKPTMSVPRIGTQWYAEWNVKRRIAELTFNADYWKLFVHDRLRAKPGSKGSLDFFRADLKNEHAKLSHHLCSEQYVRQWEAGKGLVEKWVKTGANHWLDCMAMASIGSDILGWRLRDIDGPAPEAEGDLDDWYARMQNRV